jgi:hypothetical protein
VPPPLLPLTVLPPQVDAVLQEGDEQKPSGVATGAAVLGAAAGLAVFGVVGAVAGAGALAYASTRDDKLGEVAKTGGTAVVQAAQKAKELDAEHVGLREKASSAYASAPQVGLEESAAALSVKAKVAGGALAEKAQPLVAKAKVTGSSVAEKWKGFDERNQVTEHTVAAAGKTKEAVKEGLSKLSALDEHYEVSKKLQAGVTTGFQVRFPSCDSSSPPRAPRADTCVSASALPSPPSVPARRNRRS